MKRRFFLSGAIAAPVAATATLAQAQDWAPPFAPVQGEGFVELQENGEDVLLLVGRAGQTTDRALNAARVALHQARVQAPLNIYEAEMAALPPALPESALPSLDDGSACVVLCRSYEVVRIWSDSQIAGNPDMLLGA